MVGASIESVVVVELAALVGTVAAVAGAALAGPESAPLHAAIATAPAVSKTVAAHLMRYMLGTPNILNQERFLKS